MFNKLLLRILTAPSSVGLALTLLIVAGIASYPGLKTDLFPSLGFPILNILTELPNFSSLEMERQITLPIESASGGVLGVQGVRSTSATGISMVSVEFPWGTDILIARQRLLEALSQIRAQLPPGAEPSVESLSAALALIEGYSFQGGTDPVKLRDQAVYDLKPRIQRIPGVYKVVVMGGKILEYAVHPNPFLLIKYDVTLDDLKNSLSSNNILATPGVINRYAQELVLHVNGQFEDLSEVKNLVVAIKNGIPIHVQDLAEVSESYQYERGDTSERGAPTVLINIYKQPGFDTPDVAKAIATEIAAFRETLGTAFSLRNYYDQAELVNASIGSVKESVWIGAIFVVLVLALFLRNLKTTLVVTLSIPFSVITALILIRLFGVGLNIMSLGGLAIGTGIIVDDAIVVLENIFRWFSTPSLRRTMKSQEIILHATSEVVRPVVVSTFTNIGIFFPMIFVEGFAGRLFEPVSLTVTFALLASLVIALTVIPVLSNLWLSKSHPPHVEPSEGTLFGFYRRTLALTLAYPKTLLLLTLLPLAGALVSFRHLAVEFLPALDEGAILLQTVMPPGTSLPEAKTMGLKLENWLKNIPGVVTVTRRTGHATGAEDTDNVNRSDIMLKLAPKDDRPASLSQFIAALKANTSPLPNVQINYLMPLADKINDALGGVPADIGITLFGPDLQKLHEISEQLLNPLKSVAGLIDLRPPSDIPVPSLEITINKKEAGKLGITERSIFDALEAYSTGLTATSVRQVQKEIKVMIHLTNPGEHLDLETLESLPLKTISGSIVPLEQVAQIGYSDIPSEINHEHLTRKLTITANTEGRSTQVIAAELREIMNKIKMPMGYSWGFAGKYKSEQSALRNMEMVFLLAIFVVAIILWIEFQSWAEVGLILLTIPLAAIGGIFSLWICHETINISSMIGAIMLVGIVVRNGIMLLDYMNSELRSGKPLAEAIQLAAQKRVRPILMTATVTTLGLLPIGIGFGTGSELLRPLAIAVIGGLISSTFLTLLVLPAATEITLKRLKIPKTGHLALILGIALLGSLNPAVASTELSLPDCIQLSKTRSLQVIQATLNASKIEAQMQEAKSQKLPQLFGSIQFSQTDNLSTQLTDANTLTLTVQQKAFPFSQLWIQAEQQERSFQASQKGVIESEQDVELLIKQLYFDILLDTDILGNISKVESVLEDLLATVLPKYSIGGVPPFDLAQVRTGILQLQKQSAITRAQQKGQISRLSQLLGLPADTEVSLKRVDAFPEIPTHSAAQVLEFHSNPTLERLRLQVETSEIGFRAARAGYLPSLNIGLDGDYAGPTPTSLSSGWTLRAGLQIPIFNWGQIAAQVRQQSVNMTLKETELGITQQKLNADFIEAHALALANLQNEKKFKDLLSEVHRATLVSITRYRQRVTTILEVAGALNLWMNTLSNERNAYYAYLGSLAQMERYRGESQSVTYQ
jgi:CzcA family heavy metal efflux pump